MLIQKPRIPIKDFLIFGLLPSPLKKTIYRLMGYRIGKGVSIGFGAIICGKEVEIGDYTKIGFFTIVRGTRIRIGSHVSIGSTTFLDTPFMEIGDETKINEQVFVGGLQLHDSRFVLGRNCQVAQMAFINPAKSVIVGDDTAIGGHCLLFGHNSWLSEFEGHDVVFKPIEIGNSVTLAWRVFLLPGTKIGNGSVIAPGSLVNRTIPPQSVAAGYPARVISKAPDFPKKVSEEEKIGILKNIVDEMIRYFDGSGLSCSGSDHYFEILQVKKGILGKKQKKWSLGVAYEEISGPESIPGGGRAPNVFISLRQLPKEVRRILNAKGTMWLDIEKKERPLFWNDLGDEVALFLRRYGVRFYRVES